MNGSQQLHLHLMMICSSWRSSMTTTFLLLMLVVPSIKPSDAQIGVCYGMNGNNLPSEQDVVNLYRFNGITSMRLYGPNQEVLKALQGSNIDLLIGVPNDQLESIGSNTSAAIHWVRHNVIPYASSVNIRYIAVGNVVIPDDSNAGYVLSAMLNIQNSLVAAKLAHQIKVSTAVKSSILSNTFPPSSSVFSGYTTNYLPSIINFLKSNGSPLLTNIYPYMSYMGYNNNVSLDQALFNAPAETILVTDVNGLKYNNLFDVQVDSFYAAMEEMGGQGIDIVVSETGWPSQGSNAATVENARVYYKNLIEHVKNGTPKRPGRLLETYLFAMFDEDLKPGDEIERHFGLFTPIKRNKYNISFTQPKFIYIMCDVD